MASTGNQSQPNRRLRTWPFRGRHTILEGIAREKSDRRVNHASELDLKQVKSFQSIFTTDSSKSIEIIERDSPFSPTTVSINKGNVIITNLHTKLSDVENRTECPICCHFLPSTELKQMPCCSTKLCSSCLLTHIITNIRNAKIRIECPACCEDINSATILYNNEVPLSIRQRFQQILAQDLSEKEGTCLKLCPHCNFITILSEDNPLVRGKPTRRTSQEWIHCEQCQGKWCWPCYAPSHPHVTCRHFQKNHTQLAAWAKSRRSTNSQQRNAQRCPQCSIYIEKTGGCDHMMCVKCNARFCYRCGAKMRLPFYVGHDAKYSIFGCKYKLWPNRPVLRWLVRGTIFASALLVTPIVFSALVLLIAIGIPTALIVGCFALPVFACLECKNRFQI